MKLQSGDFPKHILINVQRGKVWSIEGQTFSTDNLPNRLEATFVNLEEVKILCKRTILVKYSVEPIFSLKMISRQDEYGNEYFNLESLNKICSLIFQPGMKKVRTAIPQDEFVGTNSDERSYWLYTPDDKHYLRYCEKGIVWKTSIIGCENGYYYEHYKSKDDSIFRKVGDRDCLLKEPRAVKPVVFFYAKAFAKSPKMSLAFA